MLPPTYDEMVALREQQRLRSPGLAYDFCGYRHVLSYKLVNSFIRKILRYSDLFLVTHFAERTGSSHIPRDTFDGFDSGGRSVSPSSRRQSQYASIRVGGGGRHLRRPSGVWRLLEPSDIACTWDCIEVGQPVCV